MKPVSLLLAALLCAAGAGPALAGGKADKSAVTVCKDGSSFTLGSECGGHGGIDRAATRERAAAFRDTQAMGARNAGKPDEVWAMPATKTYVCHGERDYGSAGEGQYMAEAQARATGLHPAHGSCAKPQQDAAHR